ncbi:OmpH family outer membrane protein [soil metagenome]
MRNLIAILAVLFVMALPSTLSAQSKFGHINAQELLVALPGYKTAEKQLQDYAKKLQDAYMKMQDDYNKLLKDYETASKSASTPKPVLEDLVSQIVDLEKRMEKLQGNSEQQLLEKQAELLKPLEDQIMNAVKAVAKEGGFTYIFDSSIGNLLVSPDGDNVMPLVKKKLGITTTSNP